MANWYVGRSAAKRAVGIDGSDRNTVIDSHIEAASREIDALTNRRFIPESKLRNFAWPQRNGRRVYVVYLDEDLLSVDSNGLTKEGDDATVIATADFFLEPQGIGPPYHRIEIDLASTAFFSAKDTHQRQIRVTGSWGFSDDTKAAGTVRDSGGINASVTSLLVSDGSLVDVGDTLLIGTEQLLVTEQASAAEENADLLDGALTVDKSEVSVTVDNGGRYNVNEMILVDSERMLIESISVNVLTVKRAYDGSVLALHANDAPVSVFRTLTVTRGENGTTAATHALAVAITKYAPPSDIVALCKALAIGYYEAEKGGWTGTVGSGEGTVRVSQSGLNKLRDRVERRYRRHVVGAV